MVHLSKLVSPIGQKSLKLILGSKFLSRALPLPRPRLPLPLPLPRLPPPPLLTNVLAFLTSHKSVSSSAQLRQPVYPASPPGRGLLPFSHTSVMSFDEHSCTTAT
eukprot:GHRR01032537.1.p1 GENE.GHRR01032537.1~~GHRR01032537.1.p1  ORF type:complete len:105 (+),score=9.79 GHRR01032537.1:341-655(+)